MISLGLVFAYVGGASILSALRGVSVVRPAAEESEPSKLLATTEVVQQGAQRTPPAPSPTPVTTAAASATPAPSRAAAPSLPRALAPLSIAAPPGRSDAPDSVILERTADTVVVDFDTDAARTRRRDKFDHIVRQTLPLVYGPEVEAVLKAVPEGALANEGNLLTELPARGIHLPLGDGWVLDLFPETRPGRDGPLVVSYRTNLRKN